MARRRLSAERLYPAGLSGISARRVRLASGLAVRVVEAGPPEGRPVLCLHGWAANAYSFRFLLPALAAAGYRALAVDLKGHGQSDKPLGEEGYSADAMRRHTLEILDVLGVERASLVGHSMGGAIALDVASGAPERVDRLVLLGPARLCELTCLRVLQLGSPPLVRPFLRLMVPRWLVRRVLRSAYGSVARPSEEDVDQYWAQSAAAEYAVIARDLVHCYQWTPLAREALRRVRAPTLVVLGEEDRLFAAERAMPLARALPEARVVVLPGVGHLIPEEAPEAVNRLVLEFLREEGARFVAGGDAVL